MFGGDSRSESRSTQTTDTQNLNLQEIEGIAIAGNEGAVSVTLSDQGVVEAGFAAFSDTIDFAQSILQAGNEQSESVVGLASSVLARESTNTDPRLQTIAVTALIAAGVIVAIVIFKG